MVQGEEGTKIEYRVWNPFRSKLAAAILGGVGNIHIKPGAKVLYLGAASGTTVSHVADIVGLVSLCVCACMRHVKCAVCVAHVLRINKLIVFKTFVHLRRVWYMLWSSPIGLAVT